MSEREFLKEKDLLLNSIEKNTAKHWENYYSNVPIKCIFEDLVIDINEIKRLTEENQELKQKYLNAVADYETTMFEKEQLNSLVNSCQEEIRRLKKQLEEYKLITIDYQELEARNQELKKKYENAVADYENTMAEKEQLNSLVNSCQEEIRRLKKQLEEAQENIILLKASKPMLEYKKALEENQQKEFIEYMNKTIEELECDDVDDEEMKGYLIQRIDTFKEILSKYKEIIGSDINVGSIGDKDEIK